MRSLLETQRAFQRGLLGAAAPLSALRSGRTSAQAGFDVYRNNVASNFREALRDTFPAVEQVVGAEFFAHLARHYGYEVPSISATLDDFGAGLASFLETFPGADALAYLPDLARLEWALHQVFHAADRVPLDAANLAGLDADLFSSSRLTMQPAACLIESPFPILAIWNLATADAGGVAEEVRLEQGTDHLLVLRGADRQPRIHRLGRAEFLWMSRCATGASISEALAQALECDPHFDFALALRTHLALGSFAAIGH